MSDTVRALLRSLEASYPQNALTQALADTPAVCGGHNPAGDAVCVRPAGHGVTAMTLPGRGRTYVAHNTRHDGTGEGWD